MTGGLTAVVVGAGSAGLATSYELTRRGLSHVVLERGRVGESWRRQRWDSFRLNTPGWANELSGRSFPGDPDGFGTAAQLVEYLERYRHEFALPVREGVEVRALRADEGRFRLETDGEEYVASNVVVTTGNQNVPRVPAASTRLDPSVVQLHAAAYRSPKALPAGRTLVVGGAQTGCQVAEDLLDAGREVLLSTGRAPRVPRRYRGRDIFEWLRRCGFFSQHAEALPDPSMRLLPQPQVSGVGGGKTVSYQELDRRGARLLGRLVEVDRESAVFAGDLRENVRFADGMRANILTMIDAFIDQEGIAAPPREADPADAPADYEAFAASPCALNFRAEGITSLIWCTGFGGDYGWLPAEALADGVPAHQDGIGALSGLYYVGFHWLQRRDSGILLGVSRDAARIADTIQARATRH